MRETGLIWVLLATLSVMTAFAFVKSAEVQSQLRVQQAALTAQARVGEQTTAAACNYRDYLKQAYSDAEKYLRKHPDGAPALGITAAQVRQQIERQRKAYESLEGLVCPIASISRPRR